MTHEIQQQLSNDAELVRHCRRCHRKLKNVRSMQIGYGPVCALKEVDSGKAAGG